MGRKVIERAWGETNFTLVSGFRKKSLPEEGFYLLLKTESLDNAILVPGLAIMVYEPLVKSSQWSIINAEFWLVELLLGYIAH